MDFWSLQLSQAEVVFAAGVLVEHLIDRLGPLHDFLREVIHKGYIEM